MGQKEIKIPNDVRSYQEYPEIIEFEGCPRCNSLDVTPKIVSFKKSDIRFDVTCLKCGLLYHASERQNLGSQEKSIIIEWEF